jgi:hypothetical protein
MLFAPYVNGIIIFTILSAIPASLFHNQSIPLSLLASRIVLFLLIYHLLHKIKIDVKKLEKLIIYFGFGWVCLIYLQQVIYPTILFSVSEVDLKTNQMGFETRGVNRVMITGIRYGVFFVFVYWKKIQNKFNLKEFTLFLFSFGAIILTATRQIIIGVGVMIVFDLLYELRINFSKRIGFAITLISLFILLFPIWGNIVLKLIEISKEQDVTSGEYIRFVEINYFLFEYWPHWITYFLGNGWEHAYSSYGQEMQNYIEKTLRLFRSDIGLIGALNKFGIFYVVCILLIYFKTIFQFPKNSYPPYIRIMFIYLILTSFTGGNFFERASSIVFISLLLYIIDKYKMIYTISKKIALQNSQCNIT